MAAVAYNEAGINFMNAFKASAGRADRHAALAEQAEYRKYQIDKQQKQDQLDYDNTDKSNKMNDLKMEQMSAQISQADAKNTKLEMDYSKKETIDYISRFVDGGMKDNNIAKLALTGSELKKQLYGDIVDIRDINSTTDIYMMAPIVAELNAEGTMNTKGTEDTSDDIPWNINDLIDSGKYKILVDSQGKPEVKNIDDLLAATGYKGYIDNKTWTKQLEILKLKKSNRSNYKLSGTMQTVNQHMEDWKSLYPTASIKDIAIERMDFTSGITTRSFQAREQNIKRESEILVKKLPFADIKNGVELNLDDQVKLQNIEAGNKLSDATKLKISKDVTMLNQLEKGIMQLSNADADDIGIGFNSIKTTVGKYFDLENATDEEVHKVILKIAADSTIKGVLADYIKSISGAAASDAERAFLSIVMTGGDYTSKQGRLGALKNFQANATAGTMGMLDMYYNKAPMTVYKAIQQLGKNTGVSKDIIDKFDKYKAR